MTILDTARKRLWKILCETGDDINNSWDETTLMSMSMDELLEEAKAQYENHYYAGDDSYEIKAAQKYQRFIKRFQGGQNYGRA